MQKYHIDQRLRHGPEVPPCSPRALQSGLSLGVVGRPDRVPIYLAAGGQTPWLTLGTSLAMTVFWDK